MSRFLIPIIIAGLIQAIKIIVDVIQKKCFKWSYLRWSGGFPSVHSGMSASIITLAFLVEGIDSIAFAIAITYGFFLWYDAINVRFETGKQAHTINILQSIHKVKTPQNLKERIWHTPREVIAGIIFGVIMTYALHIIITFKGRAPL